MSPQQRRVVLMLSIIGSIVGNNKATTKRHKLLHSRINKAIATAFKKDKTLMLDITNIADKFWDEAIKLFESKSLEPTLFLSISVSFDERRFRDAGMSRRLVEDYYYPLKSDDAVEVEKTTSEMAIWFYNKISQSLGIDGYKKRILKI